MSTSISPMSARIFSTSGAISAILRRSCGYALTSPLAASLAADSARRSSRMSTMATLAPLLTRMSAIAKPMPRADPVTTQT